MNEVGLDVACAGCSLLLTVLRCFGLPPVDLPRSGRWERSAARRRQPAEAPGAGATKPKARGDRAARPAPDAPVPGNPDYQPEQSPVAPTATRRCRLPPVGVGRRERPGTARLHRAGRRRGAEPRRLRSRRACSRDRRPAIRRSISPAATERFNQVSSDLALGHVKKPARIDWWVVDNDLNAAKQDALLRARLPQHDLTAALNGLLPTHPQYAALKAALAATPASDEAKRDRIRLNMDRWRWLPRDLGDKYIIVNVPGFHATLVENGVNRWKQRAIAGKLSTPTPQLNATAIGVILNPVVGSAQEHRA